MSCTREVGPDARIQVGADGPALRTQQARSGLTPSRIRALLEVPSGKAHESAEERERDDALFRESAAILREFERTGEGATGAR